MVVGEGERDLGIRVVDGWGDAVGAGYVLIIRFCFDRSMLSGSAAALEYSRCSIGDVLALEAIGIKRPGRLCLWKDPKMNLYNTKT